MGMKCNRFGNSESNLADLGSSFSELYTFLIHFTDKDEALHPYLCLFFKHASLLKLIRSMKGEIKYRGACLCRIGQIVIHV